MGKLLYLGFIIDGEPSFQKRIINVVSEWKVGLVSMIETRLRVPRFLITSINLIMDYCLIMEVFMCASTRCLVRIFDSGLPLWFEVYCWILPSQSPLGNVCLNWLESLEYCGYIYNFRNLKGYHAWRSNGILLLAAPRFQTKLWKKAFSFSSPRSFEKPNLKRSEIISLKAFCSFFETATSRILSAVLVF